MLAKIKQLFYTSRPISWINTAFPFAAGYYIVTGRVDMTLIIGTLFFLIPYNLLMYGVNDVFDYESDILNPRKGGIEGAKLAKSTHPFILICSFGIVIPFIIFLLSKSNQNGKIILLFVVFAVLAYSLPKLRFKERAFLDSITSSTHFVGPLVYAITFGSFTNTSILIIISFFLWGMASHALGAVQDITPDKAAGIGSVATVLGARQTVRLSGLLYAISALLLLLLGWKGAIAGASISLYIFNIRSYFNILEKDAEKINIAWKRFIKLNAFTGFIVTMLMIYEVVL